MEITNVYAEMFKLFREWYYKTKLIPDTEVAKVVFIDFYKRATEAGLKKIEELAQSKKDELVKEAGQSRIRCKILYLIKTL